VGEAEGLNLFGCPEGLIVGSDVGWKDGHTDGLDGFMLGWFVG